MTATPTTLRELPAKWRALIADMDNRRLTDIGFGRLEQLEECADELEAALAGAVDTSELCTYPRCECQGQCQYATPPASGEAGAVGKWSSDWSPEDACEQFIAAEIDAAPEAARRLGDYLARVLDEDKWKTADRMLLGAVMEISDAIRQFASNIAAPHAAALATIDSLRLRLAAVAPAGMEWTGEVECCDAKGMWLVLTDNCAMVPGQKVRILPTPPATAGKE